MVSELAGKAAPKELLIDVEQLNRDYREKKPDVNSALQRVQFGTSGHRGTPFNGSFTQAHVRAIVQAVIDWRREHGEPKMLYIGKDTHAISDAAQRTALEVLAANKIETEYQAGDTATPTPVISHRILTSNALFGPDYSDGLIITPSHNPPSDGGIKYNPTNGGAADTDITGWTQDRANQYLANDNRDVRWLDYDEAIASPTIHAVDFHARYIDDLENVVDMEVIRNAGIKIGVDPLGGASQAYWERIGRQYGLDITVVNDQLDPTFSFVPIDHDGKIRMDCSSPYSMANLVKLKDRFDLAVANDPDSDRHGIVSKARGLMNPNHFMSVAIDYLLKHRENWNGELGIGKTLVSSSIIDRVVDGLDRKLIEVPVGFKWFVPGLFNRTIAFGGEESAGASFLRIDGQTWTTDKDGIIPALLAAEILATTGKDPGIYYEELESLYGSPVYRRVDQVATPEQKAAFKKLTPEKVSASELAGEKIIAKLTNASGNGAPIGGLKVVTQNGWFAARPSGTENIYKIYGESFLGTEHLDRIFEEARAIVTAALES
ncbi:MAG: phosphoglucomutase (alpha-D-glucose-1,6-bisphosphate-dependent) [Planctomycetia bacterium]|nr:phosphoglucomutase (alpha-D-glucose-1,6-bisphosphate-dependent) [Planctomycetia bacterium]